MFSFRFLKKIIKKTILILSLTLLGNSPSFSVPLTHFKSTMTHSMINKFLDINKSGLYYHTVGIYCSNVIYKSSDIHNNKIIWTIAKHKDFNTTVRNKRCVHQLNIPQKFIVLKKQDIHSFLTGKPINSHHFALISPIHLFDNKYNHEAVILPIFNLNSQQYIVLSNPNDKKTYLLNIKHLNDILKTPFNQFSFDWKKIFQATYQY